MEDSVGTSATADSRSAILISLQKTWPCVPYRERDVFLSQLHLQLLSPHAVGLRPVVVVLPSRYDTASDSFINKRKRIN